MENNEKILMFIAKVLPFFTVIIVIGGLLVAFVLKRPDFVVRGLGIAIPSVLAAFFLMNLYKKILKINLNESLIIFSFKQKTAILIFGIFSFISILTLVINNYRPWYYFVIISVLCVLIFIQIFTKEPKYGIILLEIMSITINLIYGVTLKYPLYFGGTDINAHLFWSDVINLSGHIIPIDLSINYADFPLYHIFIAEGSHLIGIDIKTSLFIILGLIYMIHIIFIYYLFELTIHNTQLSLLTSLVYSVDYNVVFYGVYVVTRVMAYLGFIIILYLIYKWNLDKTNKHHIWKYKILVIIFSIFMILVHQVSIVQIIIIMFILLFCEIIVNKRYMDSKFLILLNVMFLTYWFFKANVFVRTLILDHTRVQDFEQAIIKPTVQVGNEWIFLISHIDTSIFVFFAIVGIGYILWEQKSIQKSEYTSVFGLLGLATLIFYVPNPLQALWQTMTLFRFDRFTLLISPFMAFIMTIGLKAFYNYLQSSPIKGVRNKLNILIILIFGVYAFTSLISNSSDSKDIIFNAKDYPRIYFDNSELEGFNSVFDFVPFGSTLYSDLYTENFFVQRKFNDSNKLNLPYYYSKKINVDDKFRYKGYIIIRENEAYSSGLYFGSESYNYLFTSRDENWLQLFNNINRNNKIYSNRAVDIYYSGTV